MTYRDNFPPLGSRRIRVEVRPPTEAELDHMIKSLLDADWNAPNSPIQLADDLTLDDVKHVLFFDQARQFLRLMDENKGAPLTATGNLNRAYVAQMMDKMDWPRRLMAKLLSGGLFKVVSENDVQPLVVIHGVCEYGKLIGKRGSRAFVTSKGRELLADAQAGHLYRQLFYTMFRNFDLGYLSIYMPTPAVQDAMAVILWCLQLAANDWTPLDQLPGKVFPNFVRAHVRAVSPSPDVETWVLQGEVLRPLLWFGLLEGDHDEELYHGPDAILKYRKTPLFDRFLSFIYIP